MLFQEPPPDTSGYMIAGYAIAFTVMAIYLISLVIRWRNLIQDLEILEGLEAEAKPGPKSRATPPRQSKKKKK